MDGTTAADRVWRALEREGVGVVFGHPGGAILPIYDALHRHGGIRHVLTRHEQAAAHAADGFSRVTGEVGVCLATSGPGATNLVTGLATAWMDGVPLVAITGQVPLEVMGSQAFQETDIVSVARPVTKDAVLVDDPEALEEILAGAFHRARTGRSGPVLVDIPRCVQAAPCRRSSRELSRRAGPPGSGSGAPEGDPGAGREREFAGLARAVELLDAANRPVILAGRGVISSGTTAALMELAETADLPVATTLLGLDAFPARHPRALGMPGMHGTERANRAIQESDLIVGLGLRFDDRVTGAVDRFAPGAAVVHFDVDPAAPGRTIATDVAVLGDLRQTLPALRSRIASRRHRSWWRRLRAWERRPEAGGELSRGEGGESGLTGRTVARALAGRIEASGATVVTDVGQHQMWMAQELLASDPGTHLTSGGLGTMGYALPAAVGASLGAPHRPTWMVAGDGGLQMTLQELATVVQEKRPLRMAVLNNGFLGMVRQWQELFYARRYEATRLSGPNWVVLARAYGIPARSAATPGALDEALDWADAAPGPVLLDLRVRAEENVYPIVPAGASLEEMVSGPPVSAARSRSRSAPEDERAEV